MNPKKLTPGQALLLISLVFVQLLLVVNHISLLIVLLIVPYIAPTLIAAFYTRKKNWWQICFWNIFFGLTGIGWVICFVWSAIPDKGDVPDSPQLQAMKARLKALSDSDIRRALALASQTGHPEDQEALNAKVAEYKAKYGTTPHAIRECLEAQAKMEESAKQERDTLLRKAEALEQQYWQTNDSALLPRIKELREKAARPGQN